MLDFEWLKDIFITALGKNYVKKKTFLDANYMMCLNNKKTKEISLRQENE